MLNRVGGVPASIPGSRDESRVGALREGREKGRVMAADDLIRLAWEAEHDGRARLRDLLLTMAVAESRPTDVWADRCRSRLVLDRPDHYLGQFATIGLALEDPRVVEANARLRAKFPETKVQTLLLKARARRGPYLGRVESLDAMIDDLAGPLADLENVRRDVAQASRGPIHRTRSPRPLAFAPAYPTHPSSLEVASSRSRDRTVPHPDETLPEPPLEEVETFYLTVLLAIAFLLACAQEPA